MRLLYICLDPGITLGAAKGAAVHVAEMLRAMGTLGHQTALVDGGYPDRRRAVRNGIAALRPKVVYERYALERVEGLEEARRARLPFLLEVNAPLAWERRRFGKRVPSAGARRTELRLWRQADLVVVPSPILAGMVDAAGARQVMVVPNGVDIHHFSPGPADPILRARLGLDGNFVVAFAGSLKPWHDLDTIVAAVARLPNSLRPALLVIGDGPGRQHLEATAGAAGVRAVLTGAVQHREVPALLRLAGACVAALPADPSLHYFSPIKAVEYLATGRPVVVSEAGDLASLAAAGAALSYAPGDPGELAARLEALAGDPALCTRLSRAGRELAARRTWAAAAATTIQAAERLAAAFARA